MTYESTCPRCGAMLTSGGCLSCGYPSLRLDSKVGADTNGGGTEFVKFPVLMSALELNATLTARLEEMKSMYETSHASRMHAEDAVRRLEAEIVNHESWLTTQQAATYAAEAERDEARRELAEAEEAIRWYHGYDDHDGVPEFPACESDAPYRFRSVAKDHFPAVRRALPRKEGA